MLSGRGLAVGAAGGGTSVALFVAAAPPTGELLLSLLVPLPLFLAGWHAGTAAIAVAGGVATVVAGFLVGGANAVLFAGFHFGPAAIAVIRSLRRRPAPDGTTDWASPGDTLVWLTAYLVVAFLVSVAAASGQPDGLYGLMRREVEAMLMDFHQLAPMIMIDPLALAPTIAYVIPGLVIASMMLLVMVNGGLAQALLTASKQARRPPLRLAELALPRWAAGALAAASLIAVLRADTLLGFIAINTAIAIGSAYFFVGIGVIHGVLQRRKAKPILLAVFYLSLIWLQGLPAPLVAGLGIVDHWADFRRRARLAADKEDE